MKNKWFVVGYSAVQLFLFNNIPIMDLRISHCHKLLFDFKKFGFEHAWRRWFQKRTHFYYLFFHSVLCKSMSCAGGHIRTFIQFVSESAPLNLPYFVIFHRDPRHYHVTIIFQNCALRSNIYKKVVVAGKNTPSYEYLE